MIEIVARDWLSFLTFKKNFIVLLICCVYFWTLQNGYTNRLITLQKFKKTLKNKDFLLDFQFESDMI